MATSKPRLTITLEPDHHAVVSDVARLRGVSKSTVVTEMLGASIPALQRVVTLLEALESAKSGGYAEDFASKLSEAEKTLAPLLASALEQLDLPALHRPLSSNTGVTSSAGPSLSTSEKGSKPTNRAASRASDSTSIRSGSRRGSKS